MIRRPPTSTCSYPRFPYPTIFLSMLLVVPTGGCCACGLSPTGEGLFKAARFSVPTLQREAACCSYFQPYGASEIIMIASMTAELALDHLLGRAPSASYRIMSDREATVADAGGDRKSVV